MMTRPELSRSLHPQRALPKKKLSVRWRRTTRSTRSDALASEPAGPSCGHHHQRREALESWQSARSASAPYDLVLMDVMPRLDGIETAAHSRLRATPALRPTPIRHDRQHPGGGPLRLLRGGNGRIPGQAARSRQVGRGAGWSCGFPAHRGLIDRRRTALQAVTKLRDPALHRSDGAFRISFLPALAIGPSIGVVTRRVSTPPGV